MDHSDQNDTDSSAQDFDNSSVNALTPVTPVLH